MPYHVREIDDWDTGLKLFDNKSVSKVVNLSILDPGNAEVAVNSGSDIAD